MHSLSVDSISVSDQYLFSFLLSLKNTESETNPNNNLIMRRAGLSICPLLFIENISWSMAWLDNIQDGFDYDAILPCYNREQWNSALEYHSKVPSVWGFPFFPCLKSALFQYHSLGCQRVCTMVYHSAVKASFIHKHECSSRTLSHKKWVPGLTMSCQDKFSMPQKTVCTIM